MRYFQKREKSPSRVSRGFSRMERKIFVLYKPHQNFAETSHFYYTFNKVPMKFFFCKHSMKVSLFEPILTPPKIGFLKVIIGISMILQAGYLDVY